MIQFDYSHIFFRMAWGKNHHLVFFWNFWISLGIDPKNKKVAFCLGISEGWRMVKSPQGSHQDGRASSRSLWIRSCELTMGPRSKWPKIYLGKNWGHFTLLIGVMHFFFCSAKIYSKPPCSWIHVLCKLCIVDFKRFDGSLWFLFSNSLAISAARYPICMAVRDSLRHLAIDIARVGLGWIAEATRGAGLESSCSSRAESSRQMVGGKRYVLYSQGGTAMLCQLVVEEDFERRQKEVQAGNVKAVAEEKDVRILSVLFDTAEERWRTVAEAVPEFEEIDYDDFPLQGPRTISHDSRQLRRLGMDFVQHHESWMKKSGVRSSDRSVHEHSSICRV